MTSEGSREIEAAKLRLATAEKQASSAVENMDSAKAMEEMAKKNMEIALSQLDASEKEVEEAETFLKEAEKRWEVIDVDSHAKSQENESNNKRRKISFLEVARVNDGDRTNKQPAALIAAIKYERAEGYDGSMNMQCNQPSQEGIVVGCYRSQLCQQEPQSQHRFHLTPDAKFALREAVFSAIRHPKGEIDPDWLQRAVAQGLPKQIVLNAAVVARQRDRRNREEITMQYQRQEVQR
mmetsp:Transcript_3874/g.6048  ORF Transcript_3874/g.6048 Transcript_3874/m.6048 type:complete len:237 (-) Transcript_3874:82-792(-)